MWGCEYGGARREDRWERLRLDGDDHGGSGD